MNTYPVDMNTNLATLYYNRGTHHLFIARVDVTLCDLKDQVDQISVCLNHIHPWSVDLVEYHCCRLTQIDAFSYLDETLKRWWCENHSLYLISSNRPIKLDTTLTKFVYDIQESLIRPKIYKEIKAYMHKHHVEF